MGCAAHGSSAVNNVRDTKMAVALEFIDFVVPVQTIKEKYSGGWEQCLRDHAASIGRRVWYDDHLFRDGAMNPMDIEELVKEWMARGFAGPERVNGRPRWRDFCVVEGAFGGATRPCPWIEVDARQRIAWLSGTSPGEVVGRDAFASG